ncbi:MAG: Xaa-Pro peptidase family protein [Candidatus Omnitrophota bacterium]|jgi:Xaa-Pro aminopeptidase
MNNRIKKCVSEIRSRKLDAFILSNPLNITYLSNFRDAEGYLLITSQAELFYFTNFIYEYEAKAQNIWTVIPSRGSIFKSISAVIKKLNLNNIGFEAKNIGFLEYEKIKQNLCGKEVNLSQTINFIEKLRVIKSKDEILSIRKATAITEEALSFVEEIYDRAMTEKDLSIEIERFLCIKGANSVSFPTIVAYGKNSALPHHKPQVIQNTKDGFSLIDLGAKYCEYCADLTRVFTWGKIPILFKKVYDIVRQAQDLSIKRIKDGIRASDVDKTAREFIEQKGYGKYFGHGLGHGVGLNVHENPYLNPQSSEILKEGMVVTIEPAIYLRGKFGIRIEDMVLVKKNKGEILSGNVHR